MKADSHCAEIVQQWGFYNGTFGARQVSDRCSWTTGVPLKMNWKSCVLVAVLDVVQTQPQNKKRGAK